jgi:hypothetical protein
MIDYYKECPFEMGKLYSLGEYTGRYDGWSNDFGSFIFKANGKTTYVHPNDTEQVKSIYLL